MRAEVEIFRVPLGIIKYDPRSGMLIFRLQDYHVMVPMIRSKATEVACLRKRPR